MMNLGIPVIQGPNAEHIFGSKLLADNLLVRDPSNIQEVIDKSLILLEDEKLWVAVSQECIRFSAQFNVEQEVEVLKGVVRDAIGH